MLRLSQYTLNPNRLILNNIVGIDDLNQITSPIIMHSFGWQLNSSTADRKNDFSGFPTTSAVVSVAYSSPVIKGPKKFQIKFISFM